MQRRARHRSRKIRHGERDKNHRSCVDRQLRNLRWWFGSVAVMVPAGTGTNQYLRNVNASSRRGACWWYGLRNVIVRLCLLTLTPRRLRIWLIPRDASHSWALRTRLNAVRRTGGAPRFPNRARVQANQAVAQKDRWWSQGNCLQ